MRRDNVEFKREFVSEDKTTKTYIIREKKYPFHAICVDKKTGMEVEQASTDKARSIQLAQNEMTKILKEGKLKTKEKS
jgi:hypothetical protein